MYEVRVLFSSAFRNSNIPVSQSPGGRIDMCVSLPFSDKLSRGESASQLRRMKVCVVRTHCDSWEVVKGISYVGVEFEIVCVLLCVRMFV